ncbi:MAG: DUF2189 domain-containing protein [Magnetovibrio sp.]|nr:DUF2189 domain-containing protein [Magnetovibrio sp.]
MDETKAQPSTQNPGAQKPISHYINEVSIEQPFVWLGKGWADFIRAPRLSIGYGLLFTMIGFALVVGLHLLEMDYLIYPLTAGFILLGPILAIGMYNVSRRMERGRNPRPLKCFMAWKHNRYHIMTAGLVFMIFAMIWSRMAVLSFVLSFPYIGLNLETIFNQVFFTTDGLIFLAIETIIGAILAAVAFVFGVVSLPMMLDRKVDIFTASLVSFLVVMKNKGAMLTWAGLIVIFVGAGLATAYIGLAITLPLIGYASWHAYRACVDPRKWPETPLD